MLAQGMKPRIQDVGLRIRANNFLVGGLRLIQRTDLCPAEFQNCFEQVTVACIPQSVYSSYLGLP